MAEIPKQDPVNENNNIKSLCDIIEEEKAILLKRREKLKQEHCSLSDQNWFGIAMSGGGIRSATINMGILKTLNRFGILEKADYLSTVSGGGYCGSYVQATIRAENGDYSKLFDDSKMHALREHGEYLVPGLGVRKKWNQLLLIVSYLISTIMSFISPVLVFLIIGLSLVLIWTGISNQITPIQEFFNPTNNTNSFTIYDVLNRIVQVLGCVVIVHFIVNIFANFYLDISKRFNYIENIIGAILVSLGFIIYFFKLISILNTYYIDLEDSSFNALMGFSCIIAAYALGFITNPNAISFHRYYRKQLSDCYLQFANTWRNIPLKDLFNIEKDPVGYVAPYPLINTCLNLQAQTPDAKFKGLKTNDYFLLSPLFSGSKLTGYVTNSQFYDYSNMTLPAATTISAAAVNPGMGIYSSPFLSIMMTIFNARLGFWITNPLKATKYKTYTWWPLYFFKELFSTIGTNNRMVNISDGGHIENLAVYELLRRRCRLILCTDGGEDAKYAFTDLENLVVRARNELGIEIKFREGLEPENVIRPKPSSGYSERRYAIADIKLLWRDSVLDSSNTYTEGEIIGTFVYMKSSVTAPSTKPILSENATEEDKLKFDTYKYKIYHPAFPHEPTSDQFFDKVQWESYFRLGQFIGADVLGLTDDPNSEKYEYAIAPKFTVEDLLEHFSENGRKLFDVEPVEEVAERGLETPPLHNIYTKEPEVSTSTDEATEAADEKGYRM